jgi:hypothetical protein
MYHDSPRTARFWSFLLAVDQDLALAGRPSGSLWSRISSCFRSTAATFSDDDTDKCRRLWQGLSALRQRHQRRRRYTVRGGCSRMAYHIRRSGNGRCLRRMDFRFSDHPHTVEVAGSRSSAAHWTYGNSQRSSCRQCAGFHAAFRVDAWARHRASPYVP